MTAANLVHMWVARSVVAMAAWMGIGKAALWAENLADWTAVVKVAWKAARKAVATAVRWGHSSAGCLAAARAVLMGDTRAGRMVAHSVDSRAGMTADEMAVRKATPMVVRLA